MTASVLLVDDRSSNRAYLAALLSAKGFRILEAPDGNAALEAVREHRPSLVIADILMPAMDGYQFVQHLRQEPAVANTPVIFISGQFSQYDAQALAERCGVRELLRKPVEPEEVLQAVERVLAESAQPHDADAATPDPPFDQMHRRLLTDTLAEKADELEIANRRLTALVGLGRRLASEHIPKDILQLFSSAAGEVAEARYVIIALTRSGAEDLARIVASGDDDALIGACSTPAAVRPLLELGVQDRPLLLSALDDAIVKRLPPEFRKLIPMLVAPVVTSSRRYGILCFGGLVGRRHDPRMEQEFAATIAAQFAVAYENAIRHEQILRHADELQIEVAQRRRAEEEARELNRHLEQRVAERTRELESSHQRLRHSERMASMGSLCAGLGHDMGNLLLPIRSRLEAIERAQPPEPFARHFAAIRECVGYIQSLTNGLRMLSLDDRNSSDDVTDVGAWHEEVKSLLQSTVPRGISLTFGIADDLPAVRISAHRLSQAVYNIVNNAVDALRERGEGEVRLDVCRGVEADCICVRITDDGPGMPDEVRTRILDPFFTTKRRAFSTGLGMSLVHSVVRSAGGSIDIDSAPGQGTSISLTLPAVAADSDDTTVELKPAAAVSIGDPRLRSFAEGVLASIGFRTQVPEDDEPDAVVLWLAEVQADRLPAARAFLRKGADRRLAVIGALDDGWRELDVIHLGESPRPSEIRSCLCRLATELQCQETLPT